MFTQMILFIGLFARLSGGFTMPEHLSKRLVRPCQPTSRPFAVALTRFMARSNKDTDYFTMKDLIEDIKKHPEKYEPATEAKRKRTRKRVEDPQQSYLYAAQKRKLQREGTLPTEEKPDIGKPDVNSPVYHAQQLGLTNVVSMVCDETIGEFEPEIMGKLQVDEENPKSPGRMAYVVYKPAGWSILGTARKQKPKTENQPQAAKDAVSPSDKVRPVFKTPDGDVIPYNPADILEVLTPRERKQMEKEGLLRDLIPDDAMNFYDDDVPEQKSKPREPATFASFSRPSIVAWLKSQFEKKGKKIKGGTYWKAIAGATNVDDTGLVVICPKDLVDNVFVDSAKYVAVVGNGNHLTSKSKTKDHHVPNGIIKMAESAKVRRGRSDDVIRVVDVTISEAFSSCTSVIQQCQRHYQDGIRGDPASSPLDRRAPRRLIHCDSIRASSLVLEDEVDVTSYWPDDIAYVANRRHMHEFVGGTFLGRNGLEENTKTTCYREINGAADGFPGWVVDRYDRWLLVHHTGKHPKGPLPSLKQTHTQGVYYLPTKPDRGAMGHGGVRPQLMEGTPAPEVLSVKENGITYHVRLDQDLSTGLFLDQRPQRAWLSRHCSNNTRVLNCFAHCGAFSIAAATAGASTVSLDLNKKWLDRIEPQLRANQIDLDGGKHDRIYGDCFDWLARLGRRGEQYDIVILDPPSSSTSGKKKQRWSVAKDMDELVALAAPLVKKDGLLFTTTNCDQLSPIKFARLCKKGLEKAGHPKARLERVVPMPEDFPTIGAPQVKNMVWRIP